MVVLLAENDLTVSYKWKMFKSC